MAIERSLINFWRLKRHMNGEPCEIRPFHRDIADKLTRLTFGLLPRPNLAVLEPPRCGKTDLGVRAYVPWALSWFPDAEFIISSYASELSTESAVDIRKTLTSDWYRNLCSDQWGASVKMMGSRASGRQDYFHTEEGGCVKAVGNTGTVTGFGAGKLRKKFGGALILDDLLKAQDARSGTEKKNTVHFYTGALKSRLNRKEEPTTPIILFAQRLAVDDPPGYILENERNDWDVLQVPAHNPECTETIWPGRLGMASLLAMRDATPDDYWAQMMQEPSQSASTVFKKTWWKFWRDISAVEKRITLKIIASDTAFKPKDSADFSVLQCWGLEPSGIYLLDQDRGRWEFPDLLAHAVAFREKHTKPMPLVMPATEMHVEDKASGQSLVQTMRREGLNVRPWIPSEHSAADDKVGRANGCTPSISAGRVFLPAPDMPGFEWVHGFINEFFAFTTTDAHLYDDQVDTGMIAILTWLKRGGGRGPLPLEF